MELINEYLIDEALVLIPVLLILGKVIKITGIIKDKYIPFVLLIVGIALSNALMGLGVDGFIQGILVTGGAILAHQGHKQAKELD